ncbi:poly-beta-1,6-N-acetyl-D-glucosamine synthase [Aquitalea aquatica]|uniref:Poly-beta-1,6-N-acetyl-D-glucosamine synthase n=1 Tax=Aquitalea aquatica TaxID=3044273 RepID=A0A838Y5L8_9NEIS|nr:poly-beta-1,6-N-acetyl-D-glucosamine synthase [Aquitalea magnusonii]MBA4708642.1 poly-beta-1,6 N-acetyl-D-glucosamine synthase [Aquitalea magnusonii]
MTTALALLLGYAFFYPLFMAYLWMVGAIHYYFHYERKDPPLDQPPPLDYPPITVVVPCYNEEDNVRETLHYALSLDYPEYEVIAVNDGSKDATASILNELAALHPRLRVLHQASNQGKAVGLNTALTMARYEYLLCIDGDALLDPYSAKWLMRHFHGSPRVGAVTGNPRIRNRTTLLGRLQVGEFTAIIGLIKRAQRTYGRLFTVSGVISAFRKTAVVQAGYWSDDMLTEDIDISWKIQLQHWDVRFEPRALVWILMPETLRGLWKQRLRWAKGGTQALMRNAWIVGHWKHRRMWPVYAEYFLSVVWSYVMAFIIVSWLLSLLLPGIVPVMESPFLPGWHGVVLGVTCMLQFATSKLMDSQYDVDLGKNYFWMIWYPLAYWLLNIGTTVVAFPQGVLRRKGKRARWVSPDRGVRA